MRRVGLVVCTALALAVTVVIGGAAAVAIGPSPSATQSLGSVGSAPPNLTDIDEPVLLFDIRLTPEGDADWTISARFPIETGERASAFARLAAAYETQGGEDELPMEPFRQVITEAPSELNRTMTLTEVTRSVNRDGEVGSLELSFTWTGYAAADDDRIYHGDIYTVTEGGWFSSLQEDEYLRVHPPQNYTVEQSGGPVHNRSMWLAGPIELSPDTLSVTFVTASAYEPPPPDRPVGPTGMTIPILLVGVGLLALLVAVTIVAVDRRPDDLLLDALSPLQAIFAGGIGVDQAGGNGDATPDPDDAAEAPHPMADPELLSDEERVLRLIELNDGRMKQGAIVDETDWSNAKVSQLLSQLANDGEVEKLRIGRENLITLTGEADGDSRP